MSAPDALVQRLNIMSHWQPIPFESTYWEAPRSTIGNVAGTSADAWVGATIAGTFDPASDYQWSGTFEWSGNMSLKVLIKDPLGNPYALAPSLVRTFCLYTSRAYTSLQIDINVATCFVTSYYTRQTITTRGARLDEENEGGSGTV